MNTEPMTIEENSLKINAKSNADNRANDLFDFSYGSEMPEDFNLKYLHRIFENSATVFPEHTAILFENESISYSELNKKANQMASWLQSKGIQQGDFVGILLKRSVEFYISMLGILKAGAAYVPLDISYPVDRVKYIMEDAGVKLVISHSYFKERFLHFTGNIFNADIEFKNIFNDHFIDTNPDINFGNHSSAYVIYTSGSTGLPKGVVISHAAVCNLVKAEQKIFPLTQKDKVIQGFSIAFDASIEEIWLAFASGATLFPVSEDIMHSGADLADFIKLHQITTLSTVPTLLSMMQPILPSLKLLILGGENCPHELLQRWNSRGLRITNTYGPTEATVIATYADFNTEEKITIGKPVPNYAVFILDENLKPVPQGVSGELCIGGKGLATGYLNRDELNHEKFIIPSFPIKNNFPQRIYRSGDLARYNEKGQLEFLGRIDSQVKLRGYRIELAEIESQLLLIDNIKNAAVVVKEGEFKVQRLIAYIILKDTSKPFNEELCRQYLKSKLAPYMIPAMFLVLHEFPKLASGKTDRKNLPEPDYTPKAGYREIIEPVTYEELKIYELWKRYFAPQQVSSTDDFFDLGGHSLIASLIVSELRKTEGFEQISVPDIYEFRTIEKLAAKVAQFKSTNRDRENKNSKDTEFHKVSKGRFVLTTLLQTGSFYLLLLVTSTGLLSPFVLERLFPDISTYQLIGFSTLFAISTFPALIIVSIIFKWVLVGKFKEGRYPLWGSYYFKFWLVKKFIDLTPLGLLAGTPFLNFYFRLMGAKIGKGVYLGSERIRVFDLCTIGEGSSIAREAHLTGYTVTKGYLIIGRINIGKNCFVGTRSAVSEGTVMEDNSTLGELSLLPKGDRIPKNENWEGSPAKKVNSSKMDKLIAEHKKKGLPYILYLALQFFAVLTLLVFPLTLLIPFSLTFYEVDLNYGFHWAILSTLPSAAVYLFLFCLFVAGTKWLIIGKTKEEDFSIYSFRYIRKWMVDAVMQFTLLTFRSIYATIYLPSWLRMMGAKVGWRAEVSTVNQISPDLLNIGDGSFLADSVSIGSPVVRDGVMFLRRTTIGNKTFIGNGAVLACGDQVGNDCLIGVLSVPPHGINEDKVNGTSWLGSPPMFLPKRQESQIFPEKYTFHPSIDLIIKRGIIEFFKITLPVAISACLIALFYKLIYNVILIESFTSVVLFAPVLLFALMFTTIFITLAFKWIIIGRFKPFNTPLWSVYVWKNEFINSLCESMVYPLVVNMFLGTPYAAFFFRLMGSKIGKRVFMETTEITEFDLVHIGDDVALNNLCTIQTHLFEDRVMKMSDLYIGNKCSVGSMSVLLYDSVMEDEAVIDSLSLVMKGETIPAKTKWKGSPVKFVQ